MSNPNLKDNKTKRFFGEMFRRPIRLLSPTLYVKMQYRYITHHKLNLKKPVRYTEKLQYLRLYVYPKDPLVIKCASRDGVREYLKEQGLEKILIPIQGIYQNFDEIDFNKIQIPCVIKCTHASSYNAIIRQKEELNIGLLRSKFQKYLKTNYGKKTVEPHYSKIKPQIIIEDYVGDIASLPVEYKIHCFNGIPKSLYVVSNRGVDIRYDNFYIDWTPFKESQFNGWKASETLPNRPTNFNEMIKIATILAKPFPFVRVDLYNINGQIYFSELTFTPAKGTLIFDEDQADFIMGEWLDINKYLKH